MKSIITQRQRGGEYPLLATPPRAALLRQIYTGPFNEYIVRNPLASLDSQKSGKGIDNPRRRVSPACYAAASSFSTALLNDGLSIPLPLFCECIQTALPRHPLVIPLCPPHFAPSRLLSPSTPTNLSPACYAAASSFSTALLNDGLSIPLPLFCESRLASGFRTMYSTARGGVASRGYSPPRCL
jgi:hypothetical protein